MLMASMFESGKHDSASDLGRAWMSIIVMVVLDCIAQCAPSSRQSIRFPSKVLLLVSMAPQKLGSDSGNGPVPFLDVIIKVLETLVTRR